MSAANDLKSVLAVAADFVTVSQLDAKLTLLKASVAEFNNTILRKASTKHAAFVDLLTVIAVTPGFRYKRIMDLIIKVIADRLRATTWLSIEQFDANEDLTAASSVVDSVLRFWSVSLNFDQLRLELEKFIQSTSESADKPLKSHK
jgi:hypothetical protein